MCIRDRLISLLISRSVIIELSIETTTLLVNCFASELVKKKTKNISKKIFLLIYFFLNYCIPPIEGNIFDVVKLSPNGSNVIPKKTLVAGFKSLSDE